MLAEIMEYYWNRVLFIYINDQPVRILFAGSYIVFKPFMVHIWITNSAKDSCYLSV